ncbi:MAG: hypothetical protein GX931_01905 [Acholeplasmataceae bacterium]|jgi:ABC-type transport system involved in multi-copper enzyme maturation permease subunit|nr:hypothetical protein [Acholeplasmataceae bacterium]
MKRLLSIDLYRYKKDKTALIGTIIAAGMLVMSIFMLFLMKSFSSFDDETFQMLFEPRSTYIQNLRMSSNAGAVALIIVTIVNARDFTQNTLRLKILNGHSRIKIYLSALLTNLLYGIVVVFAYALLSLVFETALFGYGARFTVDEFFSLAGSTLMALIYILLFISIATAVTMRFKTIGASIGVILAISIGEGILASLLAMFPSVVENVPKWFNNALNIFPSIAMLSIATANLNTVITTIIIVSGLLLLGLVNFLGINSFKNSDIK